MMALTAVVPVADASLAMVVESSSEECFVVRAPGKETSTISGNFDCLDDGLDPDPVRVTLYGADGKRVWQSDDGASEGSFHVLGVGRHMLCVVNGHGDAIAQDDSEDSGDGADGMDRTVGFSVRVRPVARGRDLEFDEPDEEEGPERARATQLVEMADDLMDDFEDLRDHQAYLKLREAAHRELSEQTFTRMVRWTAVEAVVLAAVAGAQVVYLRRFFEQKRLL